MIPGTEAGSAGQRRASRIWIIVAYTLVFWVVLPGLLLAMAWIVDARLGFVLSDSSLRVGLGLVLSLASTGLLLLSIRAYRARTGELPISALPSQVLVETGPYAVWRHPIYLGFTLLLIGLGLLWNSFTLLAFVLPTFTVTVWVYAWFEEQMLVKRLGRRARGHLRRTAWVLPRLHMLAHTIEPFLHWWLGLRVYHRERLPRNGPYFVVAAHRSYTDPLFVASAVRRFVNFVTTYEVMRRPVARSFFLALGCIPRRRHMRDAATVRQILRALADGAVVVLFPEGERSWAGELGPLKREALELMQSQPSVPIVPLRIDGNYAFFPRWRNRTQRTIVRVTVQPPIAATANEPLESLRERLVNAILPSDSGCALARLPLAEGLPRLLYRCPSCFAPVPLPATNGNILECASCGAAYVLSSRLTLRNSRHKDSPELTLAAAYQAIRAGARALPTPEITRGVRAALAPDERALAFDAAVVLCEEQQHRLVRRRERSVLLTDRRLLAFDVDATKTPFALPLDRIQSTTVEGNDRLQLGGVGLVELRFTEQSVLLWQDLICDAVTTRTGRAPNRS